MGAESIDRLTRPGLVPDLGHSLYYNTTSSSVTSNSAHAVATECHVKSKNTELDIAVTIARDKRKRCLSGSGYSDGINSQSAVDESEEETVFKRSRTSRGSDFNTDTASSSKSVTKSTSKSESQVAPMDPYNIPDDVFLEIFGHLSSPADLAAIVRVCRRFKVLACKPLLRKLLWIREEATWANLHWWERTVEDEASENESGDMNPLMLPRKVTLGVRFDFGIGYYGFNTTPAKSLYDAIYTQLSLFPSLHTLCLQNTIISLHTYTVLRDIPTLRNLRIVNCTYIRLAASFAEQNAAVAELTSQPSPGCHHLITPRAQSKVQWTGSPTQWAANMTIPRSFPFANLPITHLKLHSLHDGANSQRHGLHPVGLLLASGLEKANVLWTTAVADAWAFMWDSVGGRDSAAVAAAGMLQSIKELNVTIPMLTRDIVDSFVSFVGSCVRTVNGRRRRPRVKLVVQKHNFSDQHIMGVDIPIGGVFSYVGPLAIARSFLDVDVESDSAHGQDMRLRTVVMTEALELPLLLRGLERLPRSIHSLEVRVRTWDVELLFAVRELFRDIKELVVKYGRGELGEDFLVTLGANILFDLPNLTTLKLMVDASCIVTKRNSFSNPNQNTYVINTAPNPQNVTFYNHPSGANFTGAHFAPAPGAQGQAWHAQNSGAVPFGDMNGDDFDFLDEDGNLLFVDSDHRPSSPSPSAGEDCFESASSPDIKDYLVGWNRYCKQLRCVQFSAGRIWERKFEGDRWRESRG
ncbi:hypothetical protein JR316_0001612 [Psilocybe cubensis]|uniref:F-box domain-containing protein n=2 Tax=Psilocybe cubensis TaxID=181762 RepID=A0A8H8CNN9_PSICU|nr:hypothetical protein JR316_0001612 [Psilocybe cubensis]KAH9484712.1 hypothetical protein JR316_0001612 [Psilocybe cubensis]